MKIIFRLIYLILLTSITTSDGAFAKVQDSIGTKVKNGKVFIVHVVESGQGLFGIQRRYGVPMSEIIKHNPGSDKLIAPGQQLMIPTGKDAPFEEKIVKDYFEETPKKEPVKVEKPKSTETATFAQFHIVETGETLYSISKKYETTPEIIRELNQLDNDELSLEQKLIVPKVKAGLQVKERVPEEKEVSKEEPKREEKKVEKKVVADVVVAEEKMEEPIEQVNAVEPSTPLIYTKKVENLPEFDVEKITETGLATLLTADNSLQTKNVCSHYEAAAGTIIMVTNPANNKAVFVKVINNFEFDSNKSEVIRLSKAAMNQIGLQGDLQPIGISYAR